NVDIRNKFVLPDFKASQTLSTTFAEMKRLGTRARKVFIMERLSATLKLSRRQRVDPLLIEVQLEGKRKGEKEVRVVPIKYRKLSETQDR
ncbi:hypothetical protein L9F63_014665, partial [Diploptera punctata]